MVRGRGIPGWVCCPKGKNQLPTKVSTLPWLGYGGNVKLPCNVVAAFGFFGYDVFSPLYSLQRKS